MPPKHVVEWVRSLSPFTWKIYQGHPLVTRSNHVLNLSTLTYNNIRTENIDVFR
jgi:hypothetical protein